MPDEQSRLTAADQIAVNTWLRAHWTQGFKCPVSGHENWVVGDYVVQSPLMSPTTGFPVPGLTYPFVPVFCGACGYTLFFNAVMIGIWRAASPELPDAG